MRILKMFNIPTKNRTLVFFLLFLTSFIFLTKTGYFNTTSFHRIVPNFIVQGGNSDHPKTRKLRMKYNYRIPAEIKTHRKHNTVLLPLLDNGITTQIKHHPLLNFI